MDCLNSIAAPSLLTGPLYVFTVEGRTEPLARKGWASANAPLTRWPEAVVLGSLTVSAAQPAVEMTLAVVLAAYSRSTPGVKAPKLAAAPSVSDRVGGTEPPTPPSTEVEAAVALGPAAQRTARPSWGCRPLACRRVTTLVPIRTR